MSHIDSNLIASLQSVRDRWMRIAQEHSFGDQLDGDFDTLLEAANKLKLRANISILNESPRQRSGWKWVPVEPTDEMYFAACHAYVDWNAKASLEESDSSFTHRDTYRAMLAVSPHPPKEV